MLRAIGKLINDDIPALEQLMTSLSLHLNDAQDNNNDFISEQRNL